MPHERPGRLDYGRSDDLERMELVAKTDGVSSDD